MLQFTDEHTGERVWVNPQQVSAVTLLKQGAGTGCALLMVGGFELQLREAPEHVSTKVQKALGAY